MIPVAPFTSRITLLPLSAMYRLPFASKARPSGSIQLCAGSRSAVTPIATARSSYNCGDDARRVGYLENRVVCADVHIARCVDGNAADGPRTALVAGPPSPCPLRSRPPTCVRTHDSCFEIQEPHQSAAAISNKQVAVLIQCKRAGQLELRAGCGAAIPGSANFSCTGNRADDPRPRRHFTYDMVALVADVQVSRTVPGHPGRRVQLCQRRRSAISAKAVHTASGSGVKQRNRSSADVILGRRQPTQRIPWCDGNGQSGSQKRIP